MGQVLDAISRHPDMVDRRRGPLGKPEAIIHLAGITAPAMLPDHVTFEINTISTYNVFNAATRLGLKRIVWASSETAFGLPLTRNPPQFAPMTEEHPAVPESGYALGKVLQERMAAEMSRWSGATFIALRLSHVFDEADYGPIPTYWEKPETRMWNLWSWVDRRDVAQACRLALTADVSGAEVFTIAAADTIMKQTNAELMARHYPQVPIRGDMGTHTTLLSIDKARRLLGYAPHHSWRGLIG
jgi:nucleoside-diphosphate-sugar epimerase